MSLAHLKYHLGTPAQRENLRESAENLSNCVNKSCFFAAKHGQVVFTLPTNQLDTVAHTFYFNPILQSISTSIPSTITCHNYNRTT